MSHSNEFTTPDPDSGEQEERALYIEMLFREHKKPLQHYLQKWVKSPEDVQEILQETWLRALKSGDREMLSSPSGKSFLYTIASNLVRDRHRTHLARRYDQHDSLADEIELPCHKPKPEDYAAYQQTRERLLQALATMDTKYRDAFVMHRFMDKKYEEIASTLGVSIRTVERYIEIAIKHCRHYLQDHLS